MLNLRTLNSQLHWVGWFSLLDADSYCTPQAVETCLETRAVGSIGWLAVMYNSSESEGRAQMAVHARLFNREKALEAIVFIARRLAAPTMHSVSKMLYLADKAHLQAWGRVICGDHYVAMEYGPVPSVVYNMMKVPAGKFAFDPDIDELINEAFSIKNGRTVVPKRDAEVQLLAESEIECIMGTINKYGGKTFGELVDITHDEAWNATGENQAIALSAIIQTLPNAAEVASYIEHQ